MKETVYDSYPIKIIGIDVLVIGTGGAGCRAAMEAFYGGSNVALVTKGYFAKSGTTAYRVADTAGYNAADGVVDPHDNPDEHYGDIIAAGLGMAYPNLARILAEEALDTISFLDSHGAKLERDLTTGKYIEVQGCFASRPRMHILKDHGERIIRALAPKIKSLPIDIIENTLITRLLIQDKRCVGAIGINAYGKPVVFRAKAVILACGGAGQLFNYTLTPKDITGDGYALGLIAGADLVNMEFMQVVIGTLAPTQIQFNTFLWNARPNLINEAGEMILDKYLPSDIRPDEVIEMKSRHFPFSTRDNSRFIEIAIHKEMLMAKESKTHNVFIDLTGISDEKVASLPEDAPLRKVWHIVKDFMKKRGFKIDEDPIMVGCFAHAINGGLKIDNNTQSTIEGLYAAGEVAGGPHGADRLGGNMLVTCQVFGARAGRQAAAVAAVLETPSPPEKQILNEIERLRALKKQDGSSNAAELRKRLKIAMWCGAMVVRTEKSLQSTLQKISTIETSLNDVKVKDNRDLKKLIELENMVLVGKVICRASLHRKESRGSHYREDYPVLDSSWRKRILIRYKGGELHEVEETNS